MLTVADRREGGDKICQNLADVICERSLRKVLPLCLTPLCPPSSCSVTVYYYNMQFLHSAYYILVSTLMLKA